MTHSKRSHLHIWMKEIADTRGLQFKEISTQIKNPHTKSSINPSSYLKVIVFFNLYMLRRIKIPKAHNSNTKYRYLTIFPLYLLHLFLKNVMILNGTLRIFEQASKHGVSKPQSIWKSAIFQLPENESSTFNCSLYLCSFMMSYPKSRKASSYLES